MITLATRSTKFGEITILKSRVKGLHIYCREDWFQSEADGTTSDHEQVVSWRL